MVRRTLRLALPLAAFSLAACAQILGDDFHLAAGGSSSGSGGSGGGAPATCPTTSPECKDFCDAIDKSQGCVIPQYEDRRHCEAVCTLAYDPANLSCPETSVASVGCTVAGPSAVSPANDTECGNTLCQEYCLLQDKICGFGNSPAPYPDQQACLDDCAGAPTGLPYDAVSAPKRGATIACGISQLVRAACDPARYCPQTRPGSSGPCGEVACATCLEAAVHDRTSGFTLYNFCSAEDQKAHQALVTCACSPGGCLGACGVTCTAMTPANQSCQDCVSMGNCSDKSAACESP
jgi:hypothetical protein